MKKSLALLTLPVLLSSLAQTAVALPAAFHCEGFAVEAGIERRLSVRTPFLDVSSPEKLAEISFNFRSSKYSRMNLQVRAKALADGLQVATTYIEVLTDPLGKTDSVFFERVYPNSLDSSYQIEKAFTDLQISLRCST